MRCGAVGGSNPALYCHFSGEGTLPAEMPLGISSQLREAVVAVAAAPGGPGETSYTLLDIQIRFAIERTALVTVHGSEPGNVQEEQQRKCSSTSPSGGCSGTTSRSGSGR